MADAVLGVVMDKLMRLLMEEISKTLQIKKELANLQSILDQIRWYSVEERRPSKQQHQPLSCFDDLKDLVYETDDLLDEIMYEGLKIQPLGYSQNWIGIGSVMEDVGFVIRSFLSKSLFEQPSSNMSKKLASLTEKIKRVNCYLTVSYQREIQKHDVLADDEKEKEVDVVAEDDGFVIGMEDARGDVISYLLGDYDGKQKFKIVSICGMGGIGKTTLAKTIYQDLSVRRQFDCVWWATVGKEYETRNILEDLLLQQKQNNFCQSRDEMIPSSDLDLARKLYESLQNKRYLIVLDDVWSPDAWECLRIAFPSRETTASRVLTTTRDSLVADKISSSANNNKGFVHRMRGLSLDEGWGLFRNTAAFRAHFPPDSNVDAKLLDIGKDIVKCCQGLPLAIMAAAGLLASKPVLDEWEMVLQSMVSYQSVDHGLEASSKVNPVLALSYDFLPPYLKSCFLYFGMFPEGAEIEAERLYLLWLAEGFVIPPKHGYSHASMMDVAERYLKELVSRSMLSVRKEQFSALRWCRIHDLWRDFLLLKAKEQNFCDATKFRRANHTGLGSCLPSSTTKRILRLALSFEDGCVVPHKWNIDKQLQPVSTLSTSHDCQGFLSTSILSGLKDLSRLRSLRLSGFNYKVLRSHSVKGGWFPRRFLSLRHLPQVLSDLTNLKRLRVLIFSGFNFDVTRFPTGIEKLFRLRHLSIRDCHISRLPSTIGSLLNLETLDLGEGTWVKMIIPNELQKLSRLRYLYLPRTFEVYEGEKLQLDGLIKLETLVNFDSRLCRVKDLRKLTSLQKLVANIDVNFQDLEVVINCTETSFNYLRFSSLIITMHDSVNHVVTDKLFGCAKIHVLRIEGRIGRLPLRFSQSLTEISLSASRLYEDPLEILEKLPNLLVLVLLNDAFLGKHMICSSTGMPQLKYMSISNLQSLENLTVKRGGMPKLSTLVLKECWSLKMLPEGMSFLTSLQELTVTEMPPAFMDRLNETGEDFPIPQHAPVVRSAGN